VPKDEFLIHSCGPEELNSKQVLEQVQFYDFHLSSPTPSLIKDYIESLTHKDLRRFLIFVSSQSGLRCLVPAAGKGGSTLQYEEQELAIKFIRKKGASMNKDVERVGCGVIDVFEFDDSEELTKSFNQLFK